jgi:type IV fimbrial biogenesis protein FimT
MQWRAEPTGLLELPAMRYVRGANRHRTSAGTSLIELMLGLSVVSILTAMAVPGVLTLRDEIAVKAAVRYLASQAMLARFQAARLGAAVGIRFEPVAASYRFTSYTDGDADGIRAIDIARGIDRLLQPSQLLSDQFPSVDFALAPQTPPVGGTVGSGSDPIRLGSGDTLTFSPVGTATSGSIYLLGRSGQQYAIRILGTTGRVRVLRFEPSAGVWVDR